jgi:hypothetical protein
MFLVVQMTGRRCVREEQRKLTEVLCYECFCVHVEYACEIGHDFHKLVHDPGVPR